MADKQNTNTFAPEVWSENIIDAMVAADSLCARVMGMTVEEYREWKERQSMYCPNCGKPYG